MYKPYVKKTAGIFEIQTGLCVIQFWPDLQDWAVFLKLKPLIILAIGPVRIEI